ncbi:MAG: hypothetical protein ABSG76_06745 [Xanthobacteraceae bacterium]
MATKPAAGRFRTLRFATACTLLIAARQNRQANGQAERLRPHEDSEVMAPAGGADGGDVDRCGGAWRRAFGGAGNRQILAQLEV